MSIGIRRRVQRFLLCPHMYFEKQANEDIDDPESYKVRKGFVGWYKSYLKQEDTDDLTEELDYSSLLEEGCNCGK